MSVIEKANTFAALHQQPGIFVVPNCWDAGSAKMLTFLGFKALATTSAGLAYTLGKPDGHASITRDETLQNAKNIVQASSLPITADLENGYGDDPEACFNMILSAGEIGLAGGSIEDATGKPNDPIYSFDLAVARITAAVSAAGKLPYKFTLTARAENLIYGRPDLSDSIKRLVAFADAGADVLFAPGLKTKEEIEAVVKAVAPRPVNVIMGLAGASFSLTQLQDMGVKRISVGSSLVRVAYDALFKAAGEIMQHGTFNYASGIVSYDSMNNLFLK